MKMGPECYLCLCRQVYRLQNRLNLTEEEGIQLIKEIGGILGGVTGHPAPPEVAGLKLYPYISKKLGIPDLFLEQKRLSTEKAKEFLPFFEEELERAPDRLEMALKIAGLGNGIDFGVIGEVDIERELGNLGGMRFPIFELERFRERLARAESLFLIGDNVGEHLLDRLLLQTLREEGVRHLYYGVRGGPILNDVTSAEAEEGKIGEVAEIVDTGVILPGFHWSYGNRRARELYFSADIVLAKGMGNYEMLGDQPGRELFCLLKVKCGRVSRAIGAPEGSFIFSVVGGKRGGDVS
ncbi:MAG: ARMT1-like domain-containing protein [Campylobacterales bacterium]